MKILIGQLITIIVLGAAVFAPQAKASPWPGGDPHIPNPPAWCWYGGGIYCDGKPYPDGSFWHLVYHSFSNTWEMDCRLDQGNPFPPLAPRGVGCEGEAAG